MAPLQVASWVLSIGNVGITYLLSRYRLAGWYANAGWQFAWLPYDIYSKQCGFLMLFTTYLAISLLAIRRLRRQHLDGTDTPDQDAAGSRLAHTSTGPVDLRCRA